MSSTLLAGIGEGAASLPLSVRRWELRPSEQTGQEVRERYGQARGLAEDLSAMGFDIAACWYAHAGYVTLLLALFHARQEVETGRQMVSWWQDADRLMSLPMVTQALRHDVEQHPVEGAATAATVAVPPFEDWVAARTNLPRRPLVTGK
jgi:hypothetical protein